MPRSLRGETPERDETQGGRRKYYRITDAGRAVFRQNVLDWTATQTIINTLLNLKGTTS